MPPVPSGYVQWLTDSFLSSVHPSDQPSHLSGHLLAPPSIHPLTHPSTHLTFHPPPIHSLSIYPPIYSSIHHSIHPLLYPSCHLIPSSPIHPLTYPPVFPPFPLIHTMHGSVHPSSNPTHTTMPQSIHPPTSARTEPSSSTTNPLCIPKLPGCFGHSHDLGCPKGTHLWARPPTPSAPNFVPDLLQKQTSFCCRHYGQTGPKS